MGGTAAAYFEPGNADELAVMMEKLLGDESLRQDHREAGIARAALFTWGSAAKKTADVYRQTLTD